MRPNILKQFIKSCLILFLLLISCSLTFSQIYQQEKEISKALDAAKNANYKKAIPVLKKYSDVKVFDDLTTLEITIYLNLCYLRTKDAELDIRKVNELTDSYFSKYSIAKIDADKSENEMLLLYVASIINGNSGNNQKKVLFLNLIKTYYEENNLNHDSFYSLILNSLTKGFFYLYDYKSTIIAGQEAWILNQELYGDKNEISLELLDILYNSYNKINEREKSIEYLKKEVEIGKDFWGEYNPEYIASLDKLSLLYSDVGDYKNSLIVALKIVEIRKQVSGEKHPDYIASLTWVLVCYMDLGDYNKALDINLYLVEVQKTILGEKDPQYLTILNNLSIVYSEIKNYNKAFEISQKVNKLCKEKYGENSKEYFKSWGRLALAYFELGDYQKALETNLLVVKLGKEVLVESNQDYLKSIGKLAEVYSQLGDYRKALDIYLYLEKVQKKLLGKNDPQYSTILGNLAYEYSHLGNYQKTIDIDLKVVELKKEIFGEKHREYLVSLNNLATDYVNMGNYLKALEINQKVLESRKEFFGEMDPDYLTSLANTSVIYSRMGDYLKALEISLKVVSLEKVILGEKNPVYLTSLNNLALLYSELGDYQKSLKINQKVVEIRKEALGDKHPDYLMSLNNLASSYSHIGNYQMSLETNTKVVDLLIESLGEKNPYYLTALNNLAYYYSKLNNYQQSLEINQKVVEIRKEALGDKHPDYITSLANLSLDYSNLKNYENALDVSIKVEVLSKEIFGDKHPQYLKSLGNLAGAELDISKNDSAYRYFQQMLNKTQERVITYFSSMNEHQRELFWEQNSFSFDLFPMYFDRVMNTYPNGTSDAYNFSIFTKGLLLKTTLDFDRLIDEKGTPESIAKFQELKLLKLEIQRISEKPIAERYLNVDSLENIAQQKETELIKLSKEYGDYTRNLKINWQDVQANLHEKDVAIEFVEYPTLTDTVKYAALVLRKGWTNPKFISLFRKDQIDEFIKKDNNQIYSNGYVGNEIKKLLWSPLEEFISPGVRVYFSPSGIIHQLAIENLPYDETTTLGDHFQMYRLSSTKELALQQAKPKMQSVALYGGLKYDLDTKDMVAESSKYPKTENYLAMRGYANDTAARSGWEFLNGTLMEVNQIDSLLTKNKYQVTEFTGLTGNEESFKALSGKKQGVIHIATHGFFASLNESRKNPFMQRRMGDQCETSSGVDPMLRSGLILAGGNRAWKGDTVPNNIEDGVLTAREISRMDLRGTDLVVLSACKTGLGDVSSEGVFGLQRAFKQAGAQTIIMSLWNVKDEATQYLMTNFYTYLTQGASKRDAFLKAKNKCREKEKFNDPIYWAAFIMLD